jgi:hypothetical protein
MIPDSLSIQFNELNTRIHFKLDINILRHVIFKVLKAASMIMALFWVVAPCSLVEVY